MNSKFPFYTGSLANHVFIYQENVKNPDESGLFVFGSNIAGQCGVGTTENIFEPALVKYFKEKSLKVFSIALGHRHTVFLTEKDGKIEVYVCGDNMYGNLNCGDLKPEHNTPLPMEKIFVGEKEQVITLVRAGNQSSFFLNEEGIVWGAGFNENGEIGIGTNKHVLRRKMVEVPEPCIDVECGWDFTGFLGKSLRVYMSGHNGSGQLGIGNMISQNRPTLISALYEIPVKMIRTGIMHTIFLTEENRVYGTGFTENGQLGLGIEDTQMKPVLIDKFENGDTPIDIACGGEFTLFLAENGENKSSSTNKFLTQGVSAGVDRYVVYGCGINRQSIGDSFGFDNYLSVEKLKALLRKDIVQVASGYNQCFFLSSKCDLYGTGDNEFGTLLYGKDSKMLKEITYIEKMNLKREEIIDEEEMEELKSQEDEQNRKDEQRRMKEDLMRMTMEMNREKRKLEEEDKKEIEDEVLDLDEPVSFEDSPEKEELDLGGNGDEDEESENLLNLGEINFADDEEEGEKVNLLNFKRDEEEEGETVNLLNFKRVDEEDENVLNLEHAKEEEESILKLNTVDEDDEEEGEVEETKNEGEAEENLLRLDVVDDFQNEDIVLIEEEEGEGEKEENIDEFKLEFKHEEEVIEAPHSFNEMIAKLNNEIIEIGNTEEEGEEEKSDIVKEVEQKTEELTKKEPEKEEVEQRKSPRYKAIKKPTTPKQTKKAKRKPRSRVVTPKVQKKRMRKVVSMSPKPKVWKKKSPVPRLRRKKEMEKEDKGDEGSKVLKKKPSLPKFRTRKTPRKTPVKEEPKEVIKPVQRKPSVPRQKRVPKLKLSSTPPTALTEKKKGFLTSARRFEGNRAKAALDAEYDPLHSIKMMDEKKGRFSPRSSFQSETKRFGKIQGFRYWFQ